MGELTDEGIFRRLWRGRLPLWDAFWTYYVLGQVLAYFIGICIATASSPLFAEEHAVIPTILFGMIAPIPYQVFAGVGVWRSASGRGVLGMLARLIVVVQLIAMLFVFSGLSTLPFKASSSPIKGGSPLLRGDVGGRANDLRAQHFALAGEEIEA
jgi:hypothetical protein